MANVARGVPPPVGPGAEWWADGFAFATPRDEDLQFFGDEGQAALYRQALDRLQEMGGRRLPTDFGPFREVAALLYDGPWLADRLVALEDFLRKDPGALHPVTRGIVEGGFRYSALDYFRASQRLDDLRAECLRVFDRAALFVVPTMPALPTRAEVAADSVGWSRRLGTYTNFANLLGLAALAVPAGFTPRGLPGGITLLGPARSEPRLCAFGMAWQRRVNLPLGATGKRLPPDAARRSASRTAAAARRRLGAGRRRGCPPPRPTTACRLAALRRPLRARLPHRHPLPLRRPAGSATPPRPGLVWDEERGGAAAVEVYDLPVAGFGALVASVAPPLAIGTVVLADGEAVKGFLCESWAADRARDITDYGGWLAFRAAVAVRDEGKRGEPMRTCLLRLLLSACRPWPAAAASRRRRRSRPPLRLPSASSTSVPATTTATTRPTPPGPRRSGLARRAGRRGGARPRHGRRPQDHEEHDRAGRCPRHLPDLVRLLRSAHDSSGAASTRTSPSFTAAGCTTRPNTRPTSARYFGYIDECEYLSGIVAAHATRSKKLGFVAGKPIPQVLRNVNAFTLGARSVDPSITCNVVFTGDWSLPVKEAEAATGLIDGGADVITCHVNSPKVVIETAERRGVFSCGYHASQAALAPKGYLTGAEWCWEKVYTDYVNAREGRQADPAPACAAASRKASSSLSPYGPAVGSEARRRGRRGEDPVPGTARS